MLNILQNLEQIFLLGLTGSGKTAIAKQLSKDLDKEYYNFDMHWDYNLEEKIAIDFLQEIEDEKNLIIDGIPYNEKPDVYFDNMFEDFLNYYNDRIGIICLFFEDMKKWIKTIISKKYYNIETMDKLDGNYFISHWYFCYEKAINLLKNCKNLWFYNIDNGKIFDYSQFLLIRKRIENKLKILKDENLFKIYLDMLKQEEDYDAYYQDIESINFKGYSESYRTWEKIKEFDFKNKIIFDIGCFHGYFTFKISEIAEFVYGVDISNRVLDTCEILLNIYKKDNIKFFQWDENSEIDENIDMILCLNVLHHFKNQEKFLERLRSGIEGIFEIDNSQKGLIEKYFEINKEIESHRENRVILKGYKK